MQGGGHTPRAAGQSGGRAEGGQPPLERNLASRRCDGRHAIARRKVGRVAAARAMKRTIETMRGLISTPADVARATSSAANFKVVSGAGRAPGRGRGSAQRGRIATGGAMRGDEAGGFTSVVSHGFVAPKFVGWIRRRRGAGRESHPLRVTRSGSRWHPSPASAPAQLTPASSPAAVGEYV